MLDPEVSRLTAMEEELKKRFSKEDADRRRLPSDIKDAPPAPRLQQLVLPDEMRARMPYTKDKYLVQENPHLVQWERECRKFLRNLSPEHGHRVAATMIYEWATGIRIADVMKDPQRTGANNNHVTWRGDLRKINKCLVFYFGKPYMTWIMGRKIPKAYRVRPGYYITRHRPMTLTLYAEYVEGTLRP